jgi:pimeloyl-ACP methyl ester carboxylesterase
MSGAPVCLAFEPDPVVAFLHSPEASARQSTAVVICPPFGWEDMCSYRARRTWAESLRAAGFPAARLDLPGMGDSGGSPRDEARLEAWTGAVSGTADWLRESTGCRRVAVIGIGLGGMVAYRAAADGAAIDDLILWGVAARGRTMLRELRAYAGVVSARYPSDGRGPPLPEGAVEVTGFFMSAETVAALEQLTLTELELPHKEHRRVLLVGRDALGVDKRLAEHFVHSDVELTVAEAHDYSALMAHPQEARAPLATIERTIEWLLAGEKGAAAAEVPGPHRLQRDTMDLDHDGVQIRETPIGFEIGPGRTVGILAEPVAGERAPVCAVLLNAGALRRIGPNRTWVELARRWAAKGVPTVRIDFEGIGDSDGDERIHVTNAGLYSPRMTDETLDLLRALETLGLPGRFVLVGLCSGAYWALHAALEDERVDGAFLVNLYSFYWSEALVAERDRRETVAALREGVIKRVLRQGVSAQQVRRALRGVRGGIFKGVRGSVESRQAGDVTIALDTLRERGTRTLLLLSEGEPLYDQFEREGRLARIGDWPNVAVERIPSTDHMSRALWLQQLVHQRLDEALEQVLEAAPAKC